MSIKINVGGQKFKTTIFTLKKINYFKYILEDTNYDNSQTIFVDRSGHIFKHVLALARNENYKYPLKYYDELDFYDVNYDINKLYDPSKDVKDDVAYLERYIGEIDRNVNYTIYDHEYETKYRKTKREYLCKEKECFVTGEFCHLHNNNKIED